MNRIFPGSRVTSVSQDPPSVLSADRQEEGLVTRSCHKRRG
jgi:hypothetical protein